MTHYTYWHTHPNPNHQEGEPVAVVVPGILCQECKKENKSTNLRSKFTTGEKKVEQVTEKKAVSVGEKGKFLAQEFVRIAKENNGIVSLENAKKVSEKYPGDLAYNFRLLGGEAETDRKNHQWKLVKEKV